MWSFQATFLVEAKRFDGKNGVRRRSASLLLLEFASGAEPFATTPEVLPLETSTEAISAAKIRR